MIDQIIKDCPLAWEEFGETIKSHPKQKISTEASMWNSHEISINIDYTDEYRERGSYSVGYNFRDWYDYFDKLKIFVMVDTYEFDGERKLSNRKFQSWVLLNDGRNKTLEEVDTRIEAEWNGFYEAFLSREEQLKEKK